MSTNYHRLIRIIIFLIILIDQFHPMGSITCNSQFCPNYGLSRCPPIFECDFGVCYDKYVFHKNKRNWVYVESGCSTEFQSSMIGKCSGDTERGYTCVCNNSSYCNYNHRRLEGTNPHGRLTERRLRELSCLHYDQPIECNQNGYSFNSCNITGNSYCLVGRMITGQLVQRGSVDYVGYFERAYSWNPTLDWLCEEQEYETRWICTCRSNGCSVKLMDEKSILRNIDRSWPMVKCRQLDSTRVDNDDGLNGTCSGHVCYAEYDRTLIMIPDESDSMENEQSKAKEVRFNLGCRNFSHPQLFYGWVYNKVYGNKQKGQMFCRSDMCNHLPLYLFKNASFRLEASASKSSKITFLNVASIILGLVSTIVFSSNSG